MRELGMNEHRADPANPPDPAEHAALACGRDTESLIAQVTEGNGAPHDTHQRSCPHCQARLAEFTRLWAPIQAVTEHRPQAPEGLVEEALKSIRGVAREPDYGVFHDRGGRTRISARVVVVLARHHAARVPGVRVAVSGLLTAGAGAETVIDTATPPAAPDSRSDRPEVVAGVAGHSTVIGITLAADYGHDLIALAARVRAVVAEGVRRETGLEPVAVSVDIDDVFV